METEFFMERDLIEKIFKSMVRQLPIVNIEGKHYFVDERLKEYRETSNPHNRIRFEDIGDRKPVSVELKQNHKPGNKRRLQ